MDTLHNDRASGLSYRVRPAAGQPAGRLFLLHGVGGNETNLIAIAHDLDPRVELVFVRGPFTLGSEQYAWFHVRFGPQGPIINPEQADESRRRLLALVRSFAQTDADTPVPAMMAGFSQGGIMSASVALSVPQEVSRFAILSGRILPELEPYLAPLEQLANVSALVVHGQYDDKLPATLAAQSDALLTRLGVAHDTRLYPVGHALSADIVNDFSRWVDQQLHLN